MRSRALVALSALAALAACRDTSRFSSRGDHFEGPIVRGSFVRAGLSDDVQMCLTLDTDHLQDAPGAITTSDGRFASAPLRPIPQIWHDPLSTLAFGSGRLQNMLYAAQPNDAQDVMVFVSLMQSNTVEVRLVRGAPPPAPQLVAGVDAGGAPSAVAPHLFGVFTLEKQSGPCAF